MRTSLISTAKAIFTLITLSLFSFTFNAQAGINGTWENENSNTRNITKVVVNNNTVQIFGSCTPRDCDWGETALVYKGETRIGKRYVAKYDQGFAKRTLTIYEHHTGKLYVQAAYTYTDGRAAQEHSEYFVRKTCGGFRGMVALKTDYSVRIGGAVIKFVSEDGSLSQTVTSNNSGTYSIELPQGRYKVKATKSGYETYTTGQGFFVVTCQGMQTGNIFMEKVVKKCGGYQGIVTEGGIRGNKIAGAAIKFVSEDGSFSQTVTSTNNGTYSIQLPQARYKVTATQRGYEIYTTGQGFFVVTCKGMQTGNIFMQKKATRGRGTSTVKEDCLSFNPKNLSVKPSNGKYLLVDGGHSLMAFPNKAEAYQAMKIIQHYGINQSCFVGRPDPSFTYLLVNGKAPSGNVSGDDCTTFNPKTIELKEINGRWKIVDGSHWMFDFEGNYAEAKQAFLIIRKYGFTQSCFVGRPNASMKYLTK